MAEVLREPKANAMVTLTCKCGARLRFAKLEGRFVSDRDGDAYVFTCPRRGCREDNWVDASIVDRRRKAR